MKKINFLFILLILSACTPQVTITSEIVTSTSFPTETPIPTPTLHPEFIAWQEIISAAGGRYTLTPDGSIQENGVAINDLQVDANGIMTLTVNDDKITLSPSEVTFGKDSIKIKGYELDENGAFVLAQETLTTNDGAQFVLSEADQNGNTIIEKFVSPEGMDDENVTRWMEQFDETRLGLEGDWVKTGDGRVVLLDDLSDPTSILAEYKIFEQTDTMQVVVDGSKLVVDGENSILSEAEIEEWRGGSPVDYARVQELNVQMVQEAVQLTMSELTTVEERAGSSVPAGYILSTDATQGVSLRYVVLHVDGDQNIARQSPEGVVFFRNSEGGYTYFFVENFVLEYID